MYQQTIQSINFRRQHYINLTSQVDVELAKQQAEKPEERDDELKKKLWLRIGKCH